MNGHDVFVPKSEQDAVRSSHSSAKDKAWISDVAKVLEKGKKDTNGVITWVDFNSLCMCICQTTNMIILISSHYFLILCGHYPLTIM